MRGDRDTGNDHGADTTTQLRSGFVMVIAGNCSAVIGNANEIVMMLATMDGGTTGMGTAEIAADLGIAIGTVYRTAMTTRRVTRADTNGKEREGALTELQEEF
jgi:hypothetical protein